MMVCGEEGMWENEGRGRNKREEAEAARRGGGEDACYVSELLQ